MAIDTRNKRASGVNLFLPFGRVGPNPDGSNLASPSEREQASFGYALTLVIPVGGGIDTASKRASAVNLFLPFGRVGVAADGVNLNTAGERTWASGGYSGDIGSLIPTAYVFSGINNAQSAGSGGTLARVGKTPYVKPAPVVQSRSIGWDTLVRMADPSMGSPKPFAVYTFGGGPQRRNFFENV